MIDTAYYLALFLCFLRIATFFFIVSIFYPKGTPKKLKACLGIIIALSVVSHIDTSAVLNITNNYMLVISIVNEVITGIILGFMVNLIFECIQMAGAIIDQQIGLSMMSIFNPNNNSTSTFLGSLSYYISAVLFFITDSHHVLLRCLVASFDIITVGNSIMLQDSFYVLLQSFIKFFVIGVRICLPIMLIALITDIALALISRTVPTINVMVLGMPIRIVMGIVSFAVFLPILSKLIIATFGMIPDVLSDILKVLRVAPIVLIFSGEDKTEEATPKKKADAKKKGQVARSKDVGLALTMLACTLVILVLSDLIVGVLKEYMQVILQAGMLKDLDSMSMKYINTNIILKALAAILPAVIPIMIAGIVGSIMQTGFIFTGEPLKPSFGKLNPIKGFKNMFSKKSIADLIKNLIVVTVMIFMGYKYITKNYDSILQISSAYLPSLGEDIKKIVSGVFIQICLVLILIAAIDYFVQLRFFKKDMRMSKQEVKEEYKQMEGDPKIKGKIKQKQREMATKRMMSQVADATVVITNPTHLAIALKYEEGVSEAPKVVAKGADLVAIKIKELAKENDVPIMENKTLARMIYKEVEVDQDIPHHMYQAVAEVLAMVFKLNNK
ncbi:MAG: fused FliR family export protein/FlhB family type III secretion system protein [Clostridium sp.]|nr:fused FliR family export protein/FlhB family type III secretion system protein [Clostridium sp.]